MKMKPKKLKPKKMKPKKLKGNGADYNARRDAFDLQYPLYWSAAWNAPLEPDDL